MRGRLSEKTRFKKVDGNLPSSLNGRLPSKVEIQLSLKGVKYGNKKRSPGRHNSICLLYFFIEFCMMACRLPFSPILNNLCEGGGLSDLMKSIRNNEVRGTIIVDTCIWGLKVH